MKTLKLALIVAAFVLCITACSSASNTNQTADTATPSSPAPSTTANANANAPATNTAPAADNLAFARANYAQRCAACHGDNGDGGIVKVEDLKLKVPSLKEGHALKHTDEQLTKKINNGGDGMPAFKDKLKPEEITDLVRFIHQEFQAGAKTETTTATPKS
jgi:cytochrome c551